MARPGAIQRLGINLRKSASLLRSLHLHRGILKDILFKPQQAASRAFIFQNPSLAKILYAPMITSSWTSTMRLQHILGHVEQLTLLAGLTPSRRQPSTVLFTLDSIGGDYRVVLESPKFMHREGLLTLSLVESANRLFSISFLLGTENGQATAFIGGLQGGLHADTLAALKTFTKAAHGIRPKDFVFEALRALMKAIGIKTMRAVRSGFRHQLSSYYRLGDPNYDRVRLDYDETWRERGGSMADMFFVFSTDRPIRKETEIPSNKRAMYQKRERLWSSIEASLTVTLAQRTRE